MGDRRLSSWTRDHSGGDGTEVRRFDGASATGPAGAGGTGRRLVAGNREDRAVAQTDVTAHHRKGDLGHDSERLRALASRWRGDGHGHDGTHVGAHLTHGRGPQADLAVGAGQVARYRQERDRTPECPHRQRPHRRVVDRDLGGHGTGDHVDVLITLQAFEQRWIGQARHDGEDDLIGIAVQGRSSGEMREAGPEDQRAAQRDDRHDGADEGGSRRDAGSTRPPLQGVPNADQGARRRAHGGQPRHHDGRANDHCPVAGRRRGRSSHGGPDAEGDDDHCRCQPPEQEDERVEGNAGQGFSQSCFAHGSHRRQCRRQHHRPNGADRADRHVPGHAQHDQLPPLHAKGDQSRIVRALGEGLAGQCLADDHQADQGSQGSEGEPSDGLRTDRPFDRCLQAIAVAYAFHALGSEGTGRGVEPGEVGGAAQSHGVLRSGGGVGEHAAGEGGGGVHVVRRCLPRRKIEFSGDDPDHPEGNRRTQWLGSRSGGAVGGRGLRRREERHMDHRSHLHAVVSLQRERRQNLIGRVRVGELPGDQLVDRLASRRHGEHREVRRVDRMRAVAARPTVERVRRLRHRGDAGQRGDLRHRLGGIDGGVEPVGGDKPGERRVGAATSGDGGQHEAPHQADQYGDGQPRSPSTAQLGTQRDPDCCQHALLGSADRLQSRFLGCHLQGGYPADTFGW